MAFVGRPPPKPEEIFTAPIALLAVLGTVAEKMEGSGVSWAVSGELAENLQGVYLRPKSVEILTDKEGLEEMRSRLAEFGPSPIGVIEKKLEREAEVEGKFLPVFVKSLSTRLKIREAEVVISTDYRLKVGEWEWGDPVVFPPLMMNLMGINLGVMPLRIASEIYLSLGWTDRFERISEAVKRAHHLLHQQGGGEPVY